jgi:hypothetical protein
MFVTIVAVAGLPAATGAAGAVVVGLLETLTLELLLHAASNATSPTNNTIDRRTPPTPRFSSGT